MAGRPYKKRGQPAERPPKPRPGHAPRLAKEREVSRAGADVTQKLHKVLAQSGLGSRRDMETWISEGRVTVNGKPAQLGVRVGAHDQIMVAGRIVRVQQRARSPRILVYHKPEGEIVSHDDPRGRPSVFDHLPRITGAKWLSIGRLDFNTCGLLLFTDSGGLANRMMHPRFGVEREYAVRVMGKLEPHHLQTLTDGVMLDDGPAHLEHVEMRRGGEAESANHWCHVVLKEGRNRIVRRVFEKIGFMVSRLMRVRFGPVALPPQLKRGQYRELSAVETQQFLEWLEAGETPPPEVEAPVAARKPAPKKRPSARRARA